MRRQQVVQFLAQNCLRRRSSQLLPKRDAVLYRFVVEIIAGVVQRHGVCALKAVAHQQQQKKLLYHLLQVMEIKTELIEKICLEQI